MAQTSTTGVIDLTKYSFSWRALARRFQATRGMAPRWMNLLRALSSEGFGRLRYYHEIRRRLDADREFLPYFEQQTRQLPKFYVDLVLRGTWAPYGPGCLKRRLSTTRTPTSGPSLTGPAA